MPLGGRAKLTEMFVQAGRRAHAAARPGGDLREQISHGSHKTSEIASTIDGITFQAKLSALNEVVAAARAAAQGKGFAVVASGVRTLALRSAEADRQSKALIADSHDALVEQSVAALTSLRDQASNLATLAGVFNIGTDNRSHILPGNVERHAA